MNAQNVLREQLVDLLLGGNAHNKIIESIKMFPSNLINKKISGISYSPWQLLEHIRIAQWDIIEFVLNPGHISPSWPKEYWPHFGAQANGKKWDETFNAFSADLERVIKLTKDTKLDLYVEIPHAKGYTYLREILLVANHNSYHIGQLNLMCLKWQI